MKKLRMFFTLLLAVLGVTSLTSCSDQDELKIIHFDQTILGDAQKDLSVSIGIKKGNDELKNKINVALNELSNEEKNKLMVEATNRSTSEEQNNVEGEEILTKAPYDPSKKDLVIGLECNYAPFNWTETTASTYTYPIQSKTNEFADGYDIQIGKYLASKLDYNLKIVKLDWDSLIPALQNDTINLVIAGMTDTAERRQSIDFTIPYYTSELVLIVNSNSIYANATSLDDFKDARVVSQVSTVTNDVIDTWVDKFNVKHLSPLDTFATCALAVKGGSADAMTAELPVALSIVSSSQNQTNPNKIGYLLENYGSAFGWGILSTLILSLVGTFVGLFLGIFLALVRNLKIKETDNAFVKGVKSVGITLASIYVNVFRGTPMMVQSMIIFFGTELIFHWSTMPAYQIFNGAFYCGLFVITINTAAYMAEIVKSGMNSLDAGQLEAGRSLGMSYSKTIWSVIMPQAIRNTLPTILNELIVNIKDSSVLNVIGLTELYASVSIATGKNYFIVEGYIIIAVIYLTLTLLASFFVKLIEKKLDGKKITGIFKFKHYSPKIYKEVQLDANDIKD